MVGHYIPNHYRWRCGGFLIVTIEPIDGIALIDAMKDKVARHHAEMTTGDDYGQINVDWDYYRELTLSGLIHATALKDVDNLVGYVIFSISRNPRHKELMDAISQGIFVEPEYRSEWSSLLLKSAITRIKEQYLKVEVSFLVNDPVVGKWLGMQGAKQTYQVWSF